MSIRCTYHTLFDLQKSFCQVLQTFFYTCIVIVWFVKLKAVLCVYALKILSNIFKSSLTLNFELSLTKMQASNM